MRVVALLACVAALCVALWRHGPPRSRDATRPAPRPTAMPTARPAPRPTGAESAEPHHPERGLTDDALATALSPNSGAGPRSREATRPTAMPTARPAPRPTGAASAESHRAERRLTDNSLATALSSNYGAGGTSACGYGTTMCTCVAMFMRSLAYTGTIPSELGDSKRARPCSGIRVLLHRWSIAYIA